MRHQMGIILRTMPQKVGNKLSFGNNDRQKREMRRTYHDAIFSDPSHSALIPVLKNLYHNSGNITPEYMQKICAFISDKPRFIEPLAKIVEPSKNFTPESLQKVAQTPTLLTMLMSKIANFYKTGELTIPLSEPPRVFQIEETRVHQSKNDYFHTSQPPMEPPKKPLKPNYQSKDGQKTEQQYKIPSKYLNPSETTTHVYKKKHNQVAKDALFYSSLAALAGTVGMFGYNGWKDQQNANAYVPPTEYTTETVAMPVHVPQMTSPTIMEGIPTQPTTVDDSIFRISATPAAPEPTIFRFSTIENRTLTNQGEFEKYNNYLVNGYKTIVEERYRGNSDPKVEQLYNDFISGTHLFWDSHQTKDYYSTVNKAIEILMNTTPRQNIENKEMWVDKYALSRLEGPEGVRQVIQALKKGNYTRVNVEAVNAGFSTFKSSYYPMHPSIADKNWDPMKEFIEEAHANGIEVNAWVWAFAASHVDESLAMEKDASYMGPLFDMHPQLKPLKTSGGSVFHHKEHWLDPAERANQQFLLDAYSELVQNYDVDGLILDYIRYPFNAEGQPVRNKDPWVITNFVVEVDKTINAIKPDVKLAAAVFPMHTNARVNNIAQEWEAWLDTLDILYPMTYYNSTSELRTGIGYVESSASGHKAEVIPILPVFEQNTGLELLDTIEATPSNYSLFSALHFLDKPEYFKLTNVGSADSIDY